MELFSNTFWGIYFVVLGSLAILKSFVHINIPLFRLVVAIFLIYVGVVFAFGGPHVLGFHAEPGTVLMESRVSTISRSGQHNTIFGEATFHVAPPGEEQSLRLKFDSIFASTVVRIPRDTPVRVVASSAFGNVSTPDGSSSVFGERTYTSPHYRAGEPGTLQIEANAVFGSVIIRYQ